ncbi:MAG: hypothetical protein CVU22_01920 [Betaproteobacteria bacterium HGW-Betaproteobacteria-16]|nr:MAG: hypothetical protein CVU22_01920 [Betaproteobacteria bacterium HGW-Betaproteobacteria-16]
MKVAIINFSGNVGKTTVARHLLLPRIKDAELISVESLNAGEGEGQAMRGRQFGELQEYLQTIDNAVVDIGASNVEELLELMQKYRGSHEDFDVFVVPTVPALKQQQDTIATLIELARLGVPRPKVRLLFNMIHSAADLPAHFDLVRGFLKAKPIATENAACHLSANEVYGRIRGSNTDLATLARDTTDYKALIVKTKDTAERLALAQKLATRRLASGVVPELDACFAALGLGSGTATDMMPLPAQAK